MVLGLATLGGQRWRWRHHGNLGSLLGLKLGIRNSGRNMIRELIIRRKIETSHGFREGAKLYRCVDILSSQAKGTIDCFGEKLILVHF